MPKALFAEALKHKRHLVFLGVQTPVQPGCAQRGKDRPIDGAGSKSQTTQVRSLEVRDDCPGRRVVSGHRIPRRSLRKHSQQYDPGLRRHGIEKTGDPTLAKIDGARQLLCDVSTYLMIGSELLSKPVRRSEPCENRGDRFRMQRSEEHT